MRWVTVHGHFYQPPRENPWLGVVERQEGAAPYHDWNERITAECYAPNAAARILDREGRVRAVVNNYARMSFDVGPTLLACLETGAPHVYAAIRDADRLSAAAFSGHGSAMAQAYGHMILPLASRRDKRTQVLWGLADFAHRFGRRAEGLWLPETAVDLESLDLLAEQGVRFTLLEPGQAARVRPLGDRGEGSEPVGPWRDVSGGRIDPTRPYLVRLPTGREIAVFFYDGPTSRAVAFDALLETGERFVARLLAGVPADGGGDPGDPGDRLAHIATDGESYGHHHRFGEMALAWALDTIAARGLARLTNYGEYLELHPPAEEVEIVEGSSWSCAHGVERWRADCGCRTGGPPAWTQGWRRPLREALDWLRDRLEPLWEGAAGELLADPWAARDDSITVVLDRSPASVDAFFDRWAARPLGDAGRQRALELLELQRHAMLMYTSCGWFFNDLAGIETVQVLRYAGRAVELAERLLGCGLEEELLARLEHARSNDPAAGSGRDIWERSVRPWMTAGPPGGDVAAPRRAGGSTVPVPARVPLATYRVQHHPGFPFERSRAIVPYLAALGVSDLYSSPVAAARSGSTHGYDVVDPTRLNPELGGREGFDALAAALAEHGLGLLLDIVPNHMAAHPENPWWRDVLQNGRDSPHSSWFDIDWQPTAGKGGLEHRVLVPILGDRYGAVLERGELRLLLDERGLTLTYHDWRLPVALRTWRRILELPDGDEGPGSRELTALLSEVGRRVSSDGGPRPAQLEERLAALCARRPELARRLAERLEALNGRPGDGTSFDALDEILAGQHYRLAHWRLAAEEVNYRRFFDVSDLVSLRVEEPDVFDGSHLLLAGLVAEGKVTGVRVDHVDGLYDPTRYLERLQRALSAAAPFYVVVEKILDADEDLPADWLVAGTTGYELLNRVSALFVHPEGLAELAATYRRFTGRTEPFAEVRYAAKKRVLSELFRGEMRRLGSWLGRLAAEHREARDLLLSELVAALLETTACLPVYGTYVRALEVPARDRAWIEQAIAEARARAGGGAPAPGAHGLERESGADPAAPPTPDLGPALGFLRQVLLLEPPPELAGRCDEWRRFVMRWQEVTGPVMAKGLEDTALYLDNRLISLNEVGGVPEGGVPPGDLASFHEWIGRRARDWPFGMNASSTHDTKRSEDVRARLHVLSELPWEWAERLERWSRMNAGKRRRAGGREAPDANAETLVYQTLLGAWPLDESEVPGLGERLSAFLIKAAREAKSDTSWLAPDTTYEEALTGFAADLLADEAFLADLRDFQERIAFHGAVNGLSQLLVKVAAPGVPDFYQGTELWSLALVDPDNRRPVDYERRAAALAELERRDREDPEGLVRELLGGWRDGRIKLWLTWKALRLRRERPDLFLRGDYLPAAAEGRWAEHMVAFARRRGDEWALAVAPRFTVAMVGVGEWPLGEVWGDTRLRLPDGAPAGWRSALLPARLASRGGTLDVGDLLAVGPVGLWTKED